MIGSAGQSARLYQRVEHATFRIDTPRNFLEEIFLISGRSVSPVTVAPGVVRLVVAVLVPDCVPQGRIASPIVHAEPGPAAAAHEDIAHHR